MTYSSHYEPGGSMPPPPPASVPAPSTFGKSDAASLNLRETVKARLLSDMMHSMAGEAAGIVMCADSFTVRVLSSVFKMSQLLEENITVVENITMKQPSGEYLQRQPLPDLAAAYFIQPTIESVNRLISDFKDKKKPMYKSCHIFFSSHVSDALFGKIKASNAINYVQSFKELNLEFVCTESNAFVLDSPQSLPTLFAPEDMPADSEAKLQEQHRLAAMLATLCISMGEMPLIRHSTRPMASAVAQLLQGKLTELAASGASFVTRTLEEKDKTTLLLLDRSYDAISPLVHEFTYQAMAHDLLSIHDDKYTYHFVANNNEKQSKTVLLNDTDPLWTRLRSMHIADLGTLLHTEFKQFLADNPEAAKLLSKDKSKNLKDMTAGLRGLPKFQETHARYSLHMAVTQELMTKYNKHCLEAIATLEQNMACGEDSSGKAYGKQSLADLRALLEREDIPFSPEDKMRLLMIYVATQDGIKQDERRQLLNLAGISPEDQVAILNLFYLNVTMLQGTKEKKEKKKVLRDFEEATYDVSRYVPPLKQLCGDLLDKGLELAAYPYTTEPKALVERARELAAEKAARAKDKTAAVPVEVPATGKRLIIIMLGGLCYSELRALHEVRVMYPGREIIIGTTAMLTPQAYLLGLKAMKQLDGAGGAGGAGGASVTKV